MVNLPTEVHQNIFKRLRRSDLRNCQSTCKAWYGPALEVLSKEVDLYGYRGIRKLHGSLCSNENTLSGVIVKRINFIKQCSTGNPITKQEFLSLLEACPNLTHISFIDVNPIFYMMYMHQVSTILSRLQHIYVAPAFRYQVEQYYLSILANNCNSVTRLNINNTGGSTHIPRPANETLPQYLIQFPVLNKLSVCTSTNLSIKAILDVCPELSELTLKGMNRLIIESDHQVQTTTATGPVIYPKLHILKLGAKCLSQAACRFILYQLNRLRKLVFVSGYTPTDINETLMETLAVFQEHITLRPAIAALVLQDFYRVSKKFMQTVPGYFPYLNEFGLKNCTFDGLWDNKHNLDLLDLHKISIDITPIIQRYRAVNKLSMEITLGKNSDKVYYARDGKLRCHHEFKRKANKSYTNSSAKREDNMKIVVLKIHINSLRALEVYAKNSFTQTLIIQQ